MKSETLCMHYLYESKLASLGLIDVVWIIWGNPSIYSKYELLNKKRWFMCKVQCLKNRYMSKNNFSVWIKHEGLSVSYQYERNSTVYE